ncbi:MAG: 16S rRNA (guanine(527)-N(7))-methyltransferase RsmG [Thermoleophilaceae bacterium]
MLEALAAEPDPPTTVRTPDEAVRQHIADSLSGLELEELRSARAIADIGAGAGFPGLALAAALPRARLDLVEATRRKCEVIERMARAAGLPNAHAIPARAEEWGAGPGRDAYDLVTARALAPLAVLVEYAAPLLEEGGSLVAWKGARDEAEEQAGAGAAERLGLELAEVRRVEPFEGALNRHLHVFRKIAPTPSGFPRRSGMAAKRPLG